MVGTFVVCNSDRIVYSDDHIDKCLRRRRGPCCDDQLHRGVLITNRHDAHVECIVSVRVINGQYISEIHHDITATILRVLDRDGPVGHAVWVPNIVITATMVTMDGPSNSIMDDNIHHCWCQLCRHWEDHERSITVVILEGKQVDYHSVNERRTEKGPGKRSVKEYISSSKSQQQSTKLPRTDNQNQKLGDTK